MAASATERVRAKREKEKAYKLSSRCQGCGKLIVPGQTWKFTPEGGKVHYYCTAETQENPSKVGVLTEFIKGSHYWEQSGLSDYHAARLAINATRLRGGPENQVQQVKKALKNHHVLVSYDYARDSVRVHRPGVGDFYLSGGTVERGNPAGPTFAQALHMARQAGAKIGDTSGFEPWLSKAGLSGRSGHVVARLRSEFWRGVEEGGGRSETGSFNYKGSTIWRRGDGYEVSLDPESRFESLRDAKRFVDAQQENPDSRHRVNLAFIAAQIGQRGIDWAYPGASYEEVFYDDSDEYLMKRAGVAEADMAKVRAMAKETFERGVEERSKQANPKPSTPWWKRRAV